MKNNGALFFGILLIVFGLALLAGNFLKFNVWAVLWPALLILLGLWLLARPRLGGPANNVLLLGDLRRSGPWTAANEELWIGIGDVDLDFSQATIPDGETVIKAFGFIGDVDLRLPPGVAGAISSAALVSEIEVFGVKRESFLMPVTIESPDYASATRKIRVDVGFFISDVEIKRL